MSTPWKADVIVPFDRDATTILRCIRRVLDNSGPTLHRILVVAHETLAVNLPEDGMSSPHNDSRVHFTYCSQGEQWMQLCNQGLREREGDAVLLSGGTLVTQGWLGELAAVATPRKGRLAQRP